MVTHNVICRGPGFLQAGGAPAIIQRSDQEFIPATLNELTSDDGRTGLFGKIPDTRDTNGVLMLYQPVQRTFNIALLELVCEQFGNPRLDPAKIDSAGLVVRRIGRNGGSSQTLEGWMLGNHNLRGWVPLTPRDEQQDPDPARRPPRLKSGNQEINRRLSLLAAAAEPLAERVSPLFVASPEICAAAGRTVLYGVIPVTSSELSEQPIEAPVFSDKDFKVHLTKLLSRGSARQYAWGGRYLTAASFNDPKPIGNQNPQVVKEDFESLRLGLEQLTIEFDAFGESPESKALFAEINKVLLDYGYGAVVPAGIILERASAIVLNGEKRPIRMPTVWPGIPRALRAAIHQRAKAAAEARILGIVPNVGRYNELDRRYRLQGFVRVTRSDGCPPDLIWSDPSEPFTIAPWYESSGAPPVQVALPDPTDADFLKKLKPNVSFIVPKSLMDMLRKTKFDELIEGTSEEAEPSDGLPWICGFNIPIITICAFIVLSIMLSLLNIIFWWLPFVRICIPFPVSGGSSSPPGSSGGG